MTGIEGVPIAVELGLALVKRVTPTGIALVKSWFQGKELLILGQARVGKTTFIDYLQHGLFEDEKETDKTLDHILTSRFNVKIGRDSALELTVKTAVDIPGQWGAVKHADVAFKRNPHAILILVDVTAPFEGETENNPVFWLKEFSNRLETHWRTEKSQINKLKAMMVLMNKIDKSTPTKIDQYREMLRNVANSELRDARGKMKDPIAFVPSCLVTNKKGTKSVDSAIAQLAKKLTK